MENEIQKLKESIASLEYHFDKYKEYKLKSTSASRKPDRRRAEDNMFTSTKYIQNILLSSPCYEIIKDGNQFQFEDFWKYVASDVPSYLTTLKAHLEELETKTNED